VMRPARAPQEGCGWSRVPCRRRKAAGRVRLAVLVCSAALLAFDAENAAAQDPSVLAPGVESASMFPKSTLVGSPRNLDKSQPLYLQGDELVYDTGGNRVIARGNVEIYYNNYILTADEVIYDQSAKTLTAIGNVEMKEPNGTITRGERNTRSFSRARSRFLSSACAREMSVATSWIARSASPRASARPSTASLAACCARSRLSIAWLSACR